MALGEYARGLKNRIRGKNGIIFRGKNVIDVIKNKNQRFLGGFLVAHRGIEPLLPP